MKVKVRLSKTAIRAWIMPCLEIKQSNIGPVPGEELALLHPARAVTNLKEMVHGDIETKYVITFSIQLVIVGDRDIQKTGRRWRDHVKESIEYIGRNWLPLAVVWDSVSDISFELLMQVSITA